MHHSWGPRPELGTRSVSWISVNFGPRLAFHLAVPLDLNDGQVSYDQLRFGFVAEDGEVHGLVSTRVQATRAAMLPTGIVIQATDRRGRSWEIHGAAVAGHPWHSFNPCHVSYQSVMRYRCGDLTASPVMARSATSSGSITWPSECRAPGADAALRRPAPAERTGLNAARSTAWLNRRRARPACPPACPPASRPRPLRAPSRFRPAPCARRPCAASRRAPAAGSAPQWRARSAASRW